MGDTLDWKLSRRKMARGENRAFATLMAISAFALLMFVLNAMQMESFPAGSSASISRSLMVDNGSSIENTRLVHHRKIPNRSGTRSDIVKEGDFIYFKEQSRWDAAPIVLESHKLIFFTIPKAGCTVWKQLFRRMMGYSNWQSQDGTKMLPHNPARNGLKYLYHYNTTQASEMMTSPEWTRAIMVRDPKLRLLSAFLDKAVSNDHKHIIKSCCPDESCVEEAQTLQGFLKLASVCDDYHWRPQHLRLDYKYWPYLDFVGHVEHAAEDAKTLLQRIGAWEEFGATGWGETGTSAVFESKNSGGVHVTRAEEKVWRWYTPQIEAQAEGFYRGDYELPLFNFTEYKCLTCTPGHVQSSS